MQPALSTKAPKLISEVSHNKRPINYVFTRAANEFPAMVNVWNTN